MRTQTERQRKVVTPGDLRDLIRKTALATAVVSTVIAVGSLVCLIGDHTTETPITHRNPHEQELRAQVSHSYFEKSTLVGVSEGGVAVAVFSIATAAYVERRKKPLEKKEIKYRSKVIGHKALRAVRMAKADLADIRDHSRYGKMRGRVTEGTATIEGIGEHPRYKMVRDPEQLQEAVSIENLKR